MQRHHPKTKPPPSGPAHAFRSEIPRAMPYDDLKTRILNGRSTNGINAHFELLDLVRRASASDFPSLIRTFLPTIPRLLQREFEKISRFRLTRQEEARTIERIRYLIGVLALLAKQNAKIGYIFPQLSQCIRHDDLTVRKETVNALQYYAENGGDVEGLFDQLVERMERDISSDIRESACTGCS